MLIKKFKKKKNQPLRNCLPVQKYLRAILSPRAILYVRASFTATQLPHVENFKVAFLGPIQFALGLFF